RADGGHIAFDAIKKAVDEDALIVRLHEYAGGRGVATLTPGCEVASWQECDLLGRPIGVRHAGDEPLRFALAPYEIKTFVIRLR
ncbi:glycosyl hydrolase-related protein, partial [Cohnella sp. GbtcB17]|uniref:glycosyl hydrolase-related protein n=1 Tax=Cohnella sp. GbtcB17 TaxID=2824762 RepID=UPI001C2F9038